MLGAKSINLQFRQDSSNGALLNTLSSTRSLSWFFLPQQAAIYSISTPQTPTGCSCLTHMHTYTDIHVHTWRFATLVRSGASTEELLSHPEDGVVPFA